MQGNGTADYLKLRTLRDAHLALPRLMIPPIHVNIRAGAFPLPERSDDLLKNTP